MTCKYTSEEVYNIPEINRIITDYKIDLEYDDNKKLHQYLFIFNVKILNESKIISSLCSPDWYNRWFFKMNYKSFNYNLIDGFVWYNFGNRNTFRSLTNYFNSQNIEILNTSSEDESEDAIELVYINTDILEIN